MTAITTVPVACPCGYVVDVPRQYAATIRAGFARGCPARPDDPNHRATNEPVQQPLFALVGAIVEALS